MVLIPAVCTSVSVRPEAPSNIEVQSVQVLSIASLTFHHQYLNPSHIPPTSPFRLTPRCLLSTTPRVFLFICLYFSLPFSSRGPLTLDTTCFVIAGLVCCLHHHLYRRTDKPKSFFLPLCLSHPALALALGPASLDRGQTLPAAEVEKGSLAVHQCTCTRIAANEAFADRSHSRLRVCTTSE